MDRFKKLKKEKSGKSSKDKQPLFITDVKSFKENIKIKEILRTVKMNSSMRLKAPPGSKVMNNNFDDDGCFDESSAAQNSTEILSATNPDVVFSSDEQNEIDTDANSKESTQQTNDGNEIQVVAEGNAHPSLCKNCVYATKTEKSSHIEQSTGSLQSNEGMSKTEIVNNNNNSNTPTAKSNENTRDRKLSLDPTILSRREGLSQSELDLHSIGKSPLERKSSFFRKTMDSFVKNTTDMFKKQNKSLQRRVSMSVSLQSLNDKSLTSNDYQEVPIQQVNDASDENRLDVLTPTQIARSNSSLSSMVQGQSSEQSLANSYAGSQPTLHPLSGSTMEDLHSSSAHSLNEAYFKDAIMNSRAISMSSGLDSRNGHPRRKSSRFNRVSWLASEGYLRRVTQDEKSQEIQSCQSYQDFSCIPENDHYNRKSDTKGRRLSYQRAVSGEDPVVPTRYQDSTMRRKNQIPEMRCEADIELDNYLAEFSQNGIPELQGFESRIPEEALGYILWATNQENFNEYLNIATLPRKEQARQAVIRELIHTEAEHIRQLMLITEVFIAAAHCLQEREKLLNIDTEKLFSNIPDVLNASIQFWTTALMPMITDAYKNKKPFNARLMSTGFARFDDILFPYEKYVVEQSNLLEYYRSMQSDPEFSKYLSWCHELEQCGRLQLNDFIVKPMQRLTKYTIILQRLVDNTEVGPELSTLMIMETQVKSYVTNVNYSVRQREEIDKLIELQLTLEPYESDLKDEDLDRQYRFCSRINLRTPMLYCRPHHSRCVIHTANLRFRDGAKEVDAWLILLTDMLLICKRLYKGSQNYKLIRPKYMIDKLVQIPKFVSRHNDDLSGLGYINLDGDGSPAQSFLLTELPKDPDPQKTLRTFENKVKEAKLTYEMMIWSTQKPYEKMTKAELQQMVNNLQIRARSSADEAVIEHEARERANAMVHESKAVPKFDPSRFSPEIASKVVIGISARPVGPHPRSHNFHRTVPTSSPKSSQMSLLKPISVSSHSDVEQPLPSTSRIHIRATSLEPIVIPPLHSGEAGPSINVQLSGDDGNTVPAAVQLTPTHQPSQQTLRVTDNSTNNVATLIYSLPDLTVEPSTPKSNSSPSQPSASEQLYRSHQELLSRKRLEASQKQQYLSPDHRGSSLPPASSTRGSLKRGLAFSSSFKTTPTLTKMDHVGSQSPINMDDAPSTSQHTKSTDRGSSPKPGPSSEKSDKKSSSISSDYQRDTSEDRQSEPCSSRTVSSRCSHQDDPCRYESKSASSSYKEESPATSFRDENTDPDLSFIDKTSTSLSHSAGTSFRDESFGHSYEKDSSSPGKTDSSENNRKLDYLVRDQRDEDDQIDRSDKPASFLRDRTLTLERKIKKKKSAALKNQPSHKILTRQDDITRFSHVVQRQAVINEEISTSSDKTTSPKIKPKTPSVPLKEGTSECSSTRKEIEYGRLSATHGDTEFPDCSHEYSYDSSSSSSDIAVP